MSSEILKVETHVSYLYLLDYFLLFAYYWSMTFTQIREAIPSLTVEQRLSLMKLLSTMDAPQDLSSDWWREIDAIEDRIQSGESKTKTYEEVQSLFKTKYVL